MRHGIPESAMEYWATTAAAMEVCQECDTGAASSHAVAESSSKPSERFYQCTSCLLGERSDVECMWPASHFGAGHPSQVLDNSVKEGAWIRCFLCQYDAWKLKKKTSGEFGLEPPPRPSFADAGDDECGHPFYPGSHILQDARAFIACRVCCARQCTDCRGIIGFAHLRLA